MSGDCIFCKIANKEIPADIVYEDETMIAFKDINPQAPVHLVFIPKKHVETMNDLGDEDAGLLEKIFRKIKAVAKDNGIADGGYRTVINCNRDAGQEVFHIHVHLLGGRKFSWPPG